jgi:hypothetical protein
LTDDPSPQGQPAVPPMPLDIQKLQLKPAYRVITEDLSQLEQDGLVRRDGKRLIVSTPRHSDLASSAERAPISRLMHAGYAAVAPRPPQSDAPPSGRAPGARFTELVRGLAPAEPAA